MGRCTNRYFWHPARGGRVVNLCGCVRLCGHDWPCRVVRQLPDCSNRRNPAAVVVVHCELSEAVPPEIERQ